MEQETKRLQNAGTHSKSLYRQYWLRFAQRIGVLCLTVVILCLWPEELETMKGMNFFRHLSVLHILWALWFWYMLERLLPLKTWGARGSLKYRKEIFCGTPDYHRLGADWKSSPAYREQRRQANRGALLVLAAWSVLGLLLGLLRKHEILNNGVMLLLTALFYVGDLVCILIWCPFQTVFMKNRCCTQCRIYNWDAAMLILPLLYIPGFYAYSLLTAAALVTIRWEGAHLRHPERFYPATNQALLCGSCPGEPGCAERKGGRKKRIAQKRA